MKRRRVDTRHVQRAPGFDGDYTKAEKSRALPSSSLSPEDMSENADLGPRFRRGGPIISRRPHVEALLTNSMAVAMHELNLLMQKVKAGMKLDPAEERHYHKLVDSIGKLVREEREQRKHEKLEDMDPDTLEAKYIEAGRVLGLLGESDGD